jgi:hypothetical protein
MSATFFIIGTIITIIAYKANNKLWIITAFYSLMELLQTIQYKYVNRCDLIQNTILTEIAYVLVIVQPLLWNTVIFFMLKDKKYKYMLYLSITLSFIWMIWNIVARFTKREPGYDHCGFYNNPISCTYQESEKTHLYWKFSSGYYREFTANYFMYLCLWFVPLLLIPEYFWIGVLIILSLVFSLIINRTNNISEVSSTWCVMSIPFFSLVAILSIKKLI